MEKYYLCIIKSDKTGKYYIGSCSNVQMRLKYHNNGWSKYTKTGTPWKLYHFEEFNSKTEALKREKFIKSKKSVRFIESLLESIIAG